MKITSKKELATILFLLLIVVVTSGFIGWYIGVNRYWLLSQGAATKTFADTLTTYNLIRRYYPGQIDNNLVIESGITALINSLDDPNSFYIDPQTYTAIKQEQNGKSRGIGIIYSLIGDHIKILEVFPGSPAHGAGLKPNSVITHINHQALSDFDSEIAIQATLQGPEGTNVTLKVDDQDKTLTRANFEIPAYIYELFEPHVGYIKLYQFEQNLEKGFDNLVSQLKSDSVNSLIVDLRNNTGGLTETALFLADQFVNDGVLLIEEFKNSPPQTYESSDRGELSDMGIVILTNHETASAAEVFTAALKDNDRAITIGFATYGKSKTGRFFELTDDSAIHLTIGHWRRPNGESVSPNGIKPDIEVAESNTPTSDEALKKAIEYLTGE